MVNNDRRLHYRNIWIEQGTLLQVIRATNKGVTLAPGSQYNETVEWVGENWQDYFSPVRRRKAKANADAEQG
jgi:hypothetical protein